MFLNRYHKCAYQKCNSTINIQRIQKRMHAVMQSIIIMQYKHIQYTSTIAAIQTIRSSERDTYTHILHA